MRQRSSRLVEAHFDAKAERYHRAIRAVPAARDLEILPFLLLLDDALSERDPRSLSLADMLCGSGFLTQALRGCFGDIVGMDISGGMLKYYPVGPRLRRRKAALDDQSTVLQAGQRPDVIVSLAGLHHVFVLEGGRIDRDASDEVQARVISNWAASLAEGGALILADVTSPDEAPEFPTSAELLASGDGVFRERLGELERQCRVLLRSEWPSVTRPTSALAYAEHVLSAAPGAASANPGNWFRDVVENYGLYGHTDHFLHPERLVTTLRGEGLHASYVELPTPWIFPSVPDMQFFFYEKFALGPMGDAEDEIAAESRELIMELAAKHLTVREFPGGAVATGWRLGYYVVRK